MASARVLVTGGAGFIGRALVRRLLARGDEVVVLDNLSEQIHGPGAEIPADLLGQVEFLRGDVRNGAHLRRALRGARVVFHLAAETGTGQSMYEIHRYCDVTIGGTARLLENLVNRRGDVERVVLASSRAVYGEGAYACPEHGVVYPAGRRESDLLAGRFEPRCPRCAGFAAVVPTCESAPAQPLSVYATTKLTQEQLCRQALGGAGIGLVTLRLQNVYGEGQSLANPYTGILAIFANLIREGRAPEIYEDGLESRDFVHVDDVAEAMVLAMVHEDAAGQLLNVGTGVGTSVLAAANELLAAQCSRLAPAITGRFRIGDIRHNVADIARARALGFRPRVGFAEGIRRFTAWLGGRSGASGLLLRRAEAELAARSLLKSSVR
jgi:dTDP-L-rhamnose 4-epimerase